MGLKKGAIDAKEDKGHLACKVFLHSPINSNYEYVDDEHCHMGPTTGGIDKVARKKLIIASVLCLIFMIGEATGGAIAHSLAIMTDAAHLLTDFASFLISLFAIYLAGRPATKRMSFGWYRAEVMGAFISVLMIWLVTGILVYLAIMRIIDDDYEIDGKVMLITSALGVGVNLIMGATLHQHGHSHGGGGAHSHGHAHASGMFTKLKKKIVSATSGEDEAAKSAICEGGEFQNGLRKNYTGEMSGAHDHKEHSHDHPHEHEEHEEMVESSVEHPRENINVRAAFIHVVGDFLQSVGVMIASMVIYFRPEYKIADPICTFMFSVLVLLTTISILRDAMNVLMEGTPKSLDFVEVRQALYSLPGVIEVHNLRMWSLTMNKTAVSAHLATNDMTNSQDLLTQATKLLRRRFLVHEATIQLEQYVPSMADCVQCQELND